MIDRLRIGLAALVMWLAFGLIVIPVWIVFPLGVAWWVWKNRNGLRDRLTRFGQALDECANVVLFDGDPRETVSSHVGRMYSVKYGNPDKGILITQPNFVIPMMARVVKFLTDQFAPQHVYKSVETWAIEKDVQL